jgi:hypothetical protein
MREPVKIDAPKNLLSPLKSHTSHYKFALGLPYN